MATIGPKKITLGEFNQRYEEASKHHNLQMPTRRKALEEMVNREVGVSMALTQGLDKDPRVQEQLDAVLFQAFVEKELGTELQKLSVTRKEAYEYYKENPEIRTSHIFVPFPNNPSKAQRSEAYGKILTIRNNHLRRGKKPFAAVAQEYSTGIEARTGGDLDFKRKDQLDPNYYRSAIRLNLNQVSDIVRSQFGYHIIKLTGKKAWSQIDQGLVKELLLNERKKNLYSKFMRRMRVKKRVSINYGIL